MNKRKYAEPKKVVNKEKERQYLREVFSDYADVADYFNFELMPRMEELRRKIDEKKRELEDLEREYYKLYVEYWEYSEMDEEHYKMVYDTRYSFEATLTDAQIEKLLPVINKYVFSDSQTVESMREWLECRNQEPVRVKDIAELCNLLNLLRDHGYICGNAQTVAEDNKTFVGGRGRPITQRSLTASLTKKFGGGCKRTRNPILNKDILESVEALGGVKV